MSRTIMWVTFADGKSLHGLFNSTVDQALPRLFQRPEARDHYWESQEPGVGWRDEDWYGCGCPSETVIAYNGYGNHNDEPEMVSNAWLSTACRQHRRLLGNNCLGSDGFESAGPRQIWLSHFAPEDYRMLAQPDDIVTVLWDFAPLVRRLASLVAKRPVSEQELLQIVRWQD
jgi:hypothetical protein